MTPKQLQQVATTIQAERLWSIIVFNDDVNTFDWVIECLMNYCEHDAIQAEQCALIIHHNGKCSVMSGEKTEMKARAEILGECGLTVEVQ